MVASASASIPSGNNRAGAVIFILYVISALFFTGVIVGTLYSPLSAHGSSKLLVVKRQQKFSRKSSVQIYTNLSLLSFAVLSYHMLSFLVISYKTWASARNIPIPQSFFGHEGLFDLQNGAINIQVWQWLTSSTLFQDFAETICDDSARYWWTQQALLTTMAWSFFMSVEGEQENHSRVLSFRMSTRKPDLSYLPRSQSPKTENPSSLGIPSYQPDPPRLIRTEPLLPSNTPNPHLGPRGSGEHTKAGVAAVAACVILSVPSPRAVLGGH